MLIVFGGLPGTGKTTLSRKVASRLGGVYIRIDAVEQAIRSGLAIADVGAAGYAVALAVAEANLALGSSVIADGVNPVSASRIGWRSLAERMNARLIEVEVICSNAREHRRRVEGAPPISPVMPCRHGPPFSLTSMSPGRSPTSLWIRRS